MKSLAIAALFLCGVAAAVRAESPAAPQPPDLTAGGERDKSHDWLLGPTGLRGWMWYRDGRTTDARQILVTAVDPGSPADGILAVGDVILGAAGKPFDGDPRIQLADAITAAETDQGGGVLRLTRWRAGQSTNVELKLTVLGSYSDTAPYDCPKSKAIFEQGCRLIAAREDRFSPGTAYAADLPGLLNALALLASGNEEYRPLLAAHARWTAEKMMKAEAAKARGGMNCWGYAYLNLFLAEYVLATGDKEMLVELNRTTMVAVDNQSNYGMWGHGPRLPKGNCSGYGGMNQIGLPMTLSMVLAREAGVKDPALDQAIAKSVNLLRYYVDKGSIPYGDHAPWTGSHDDNGKSSLAAVLFDLLGDREATAFFARMGTAAYDEREQGHCGNWFNIMWALPGVSRCGPVATGAYFREQRWYYELARNWKGGFEYQRINPHDENNNYTNWDLTGTYLLSFGLPLKSLYVMGKKPCTLKPLKQKEVERVIADGRDSRPVNGRNGYNERTTEQLLAGLSSWSPIVRKRSAQALAERKEEVVPALLKMVAGSDRYARYGAIEALGVLGPKADAAGPQLRALLKDQDPWIQSLACQAIPYLGPEERKASVNDLLILAATLNPADPRQMVQRAVGRALFSYGPHNGTPTVLNYSVEGVDRALLYPAIRSLLANDESVTRYGPTAYYGKLTDRDLAELLPAIIKATSEKAPTCEMFAGPPLHAGYDLLSKRHIREGLKVIEDAMNEGILVLDGQDYLLRYGVHAKAVLPELKILELLRQRTPEKLEAIENSTETPTLLSVQEFIEKAKAGSDGATTPTKDQP